MEELERWCSLSQATVTDRGSFLSAVLEARSSAALHLEDEFLTHLAELIMCRYEGYPISEARSLPGVRIDQPRRTRHHYRRLFQSNGSITRDFITWASETLALWIEKDLTDSVYSEGGSPHAADPVYDVLSIIRDSKSIPRLRVTQVKATESNVQDQGSAAIKKFELLERGDFDAELATRLELIQSRIDAPAGIVYGDLLYDQERRYRVAIVHHQPLDGFELLTQYEEKVKGAVDRRSAFFVRVEWPTFWATLGKRVYEQLSP